MLYIEDNFLMVNEMDSELWYIEKIEYMKGSGLKIIEKEKEWKNIVMEINMKEEYALLEGMKLFLIDDKTHCTLLKASEY